MLFSEYLHEAVQATDIYNFYALDFVMGAGNRVSMDDADIDTLHRKYATAKSHIWGELIAEGIQAMLRESDHMLMSSSIAPGVHEEDRLAMYHKLGNALSECHALMKTSGFNFAAADHMADRHFGSTEKCLQYLIDVFSTKYMVWSPNFGGRKWQIIAEAILALYKKGPIASTVRDIDHILDLAHNTGTWLNKFINKNKVMAALDKKFKAKTPHDFKSEIDDPEIRKLVGKGLFGVEKQTEITFHYFFYKTLLSFLKWAGGFTNMDVVRKAHGMPTRIKKFAEQLPPFGMAITFQKQHLLPGRTIALVCVPLLYGEDEDSFNVILSFAVCVIDAIEMTVNCVGTLPDTEIIPLLKSASVDSEAIKAILTHLTHHSSQMEAIIRKAILSRQLVFFGDEPPSPDGRIKIKVMSDFIGIAKSTETIRTMISNMKNRISSIVTAKQQ